MCQPGSIRKRILAYLVLGVLHLTYCIVEYGECHINADRTMSPDLATDVQSMCLAKTRLVYLCGVLCVYVMLSHSARLRKKSGANDPWIEARRIFKLQRYSIVVRQMIYPNQALDTCMWLHCAFRRRSFANANMPSTHWPLGSARYFVHCNWYWGVRTTMPCLCRLSKRASTLAAAKTPDCIQIGRRSKTFPAELSN